MVLQIIPKRNFWFVISGGLFVVSVAMLLIFGLKFGIDFTGGTLMEVQFTGDMTPEQIEKSLTDAEIEAQAQAPAGPADSVLTTDAPEGAPATGSATDVLPEESGTVEIGKPVIQSTGERTYVIRTKYMTNVTHDIVIKHLNILNGTAVTELRYETIGPTIGETLKKHALLSIAIASLLIVLYIAFAFRKLPNTLSPWKFGMTAVIALLHDTVITIGVFSVLGAVLNVEIDSLFVTAILTVMGFSVHDTIVVFDRIRENSIKHPADDFAVVANDAVNQTMARSINTSMTTLITLTALFVLGGESIKWFVLALIVGIAIGTYSSIFVATPLVVVWRGTTIQNSVQKR